MKRTYKLNVEKGVSVVDEADLRIITAVLSKHGIKYSWKKN